MSPLGIAAVATTTTLFHSVLPQTLSAATTTLLVPASTTALQQTSDNLSNNNNYNNKIMKLVSPRTRSCWYMTLAMALHFGGYEYARSGALALFTSDTVGWGGGVASAYPLAMGLVTPSSLLFLYWYGTILSSDGARRALYGTTRLAIAMLTLCTTALYVVSTRTNYHLLSKLLVSLLFVFQNSYAHLLYTQQWSFLGSVMTPTEGTKWFSSIAGMSSLVCTLTATSVPYISNTPSLGLYGLLAGTCLTLTLSLFLSDRAYQLGEEHGFDPTPELQRKQQEKQQQTDNDNNNNSNNNNDDDDTKQPSQTTKKPSLLSKTITLFQNVPTLAALFGEVIAFQSLSTILNVCFVRTLKQSFADQDAARASYTGRFYAGVNGIAGLMQFAIMPLCRKYLEPQWMYRLMPFFLLPWLIYTSLPPLAETNSLWMISAAFFSLKTLDYSIRNVCHEMVYQPLDFDSRYLGKEIIGVFANRFGKSGMSLLLGLFAATSSSLSKLAVVVGGLWSGCSWWLSQTVLSNRDAAQQREDQTKNNNKKNPSKQE